MTDPNYTAVMVLIDRSGSMASIKGAAESGINEFIKGRAAMAAGKKCTVRLAQFDTEYELVHPSTDPAKLPEFLLEPRHLTALHDAMGRSIVEFGAELAAMPEAERPGTVIFAVMTDGMENSSLDYTQEQVRELVQQHEREFSWQVLYLGANQDAVKTGGSLGVRKDRSMTYTASAAGMSTASEALASYVVATASGGPAAFTEEDRKKAMEE